MQTYQKILIGGLGALTPVIVNLLVVDLQVLFLNLTLVAFLAYLTRVVILFFLGGFVAFFNKDENSPLKLFQLGLAAPALIMSLLNGSQVEIPKVSPPAQAQPSASLQLIPSAYAQTAQKREIKTFSLPKETLGEQFQRGFTGAVPKRVWFVIAASYPNRESAQREADRITKTFAAKGFKADVFSPGAGNSSWSVVLGSNLTSDEAQNLRQRAMTAGVSKDPSVWTFAK